MARKAKPEFNPPPSDQKFDLLIIAGEHSGDEHAAKLVSKLKALQPNLKVAAIGGDGLKAAGAHLLFNPLEHAVVGLFEVLKHYDYLKALFETTLDWIDQNRPQAVCLVDYPGFNRRIAKRLFNRGVSKKAGGDVQVLFYISPQIWAWKSRRRFSMARHLDSLGVIFPFEIDSYADTDLDVQFVGHPFVDPEYELPLSYDDSAPLLLLPGSRKTPVERIFPTMVETFYGIKKEIPDLRAGVMYPDEGVLSLLKKIIANYGKAEDFDLHPKSEKLSARAVICSSGTISLVCALAAIPGIIVYKTHTLSYLMAKFLVKIRVIGIANIILEREVHPEYLQGNMKPEKLVTAMKDCLSNEAHREKFLKDSSELKDTLRSKDSDGCARWVLKFLEDCDAK